MFVNFYLIKFNVISGKIFTFSIYNDFNMFHIEI